MDRASKLNAATLAVIVVASGLFAAPPGCLAQQADSTVAVTIKAITHTSEDSSPWTLLDALGVEATGPASTGPALLALADVAGTGPAAAGGLWLSGDTAEGFRCLQWIAGKQPSGLLRLDGGGKVSFNLRILARAAGVTSENNADQRERIACFVRSDEGLRLLAEMTNGPYRYLLHVGALAPTLGGKVSLHVPCNIDNRFDSRINPRRPNGRKLDIERPPEGFDSLIAVVSDIRWFNLHNKQIMPLPQITFHELAEAHARLALDLEYMPRLEKPGAHDVAINREIRLKQGRPLQHVVMPVGHNLRLESYEEWLRLKRQLRSNPESPLQTR